MNCITNVDFSLALKHSCMYMQLLRMCKQPLRRYRAYVMTLGTPLNLTPYAPEPYVRSHPYLVSSPFYTIPIYPHFNLEDFLFTCLLSFLYTTVVNIHCGKIICSCHSTLLKLSNIYQFHTFVGIYQVPFSSDKLIAKLNYYCLEL